MNLSGVATLAPTAMSQEDEIVTALMDEEAECKPEVHYNHYGDRGVVDLVKIDRSEKPYGMTVYEVKSPAALREVTGANEIIRQFNRHKEYFIPGTNYSSDYFDVRYELCFYLSEETLEHVMSNWSLYETLREGLESNVVLRYPGYNQPVIVREGEVLYSAGVEAVLSDAGIDPQEYVEVPA